MADIPFALAAVTLAAGVLALGMAAIVLASGARSATTRLLAAVLFLEGLLQLTFLLPSDEGRFGDLIEGLFIVPILVLPWLYLLFLARLETPLARPLLRARRLLTLSLVAFSLVAVAGVVSFGVFHSDPVWAIPFILLAVLALPGAAVYGLVIAVSAWRRARPGTLARQRGAAYALAFGTRDTLLILSVVAFFIEEAIAPNEGIHIPAGILIGLSTLFFVPFLAYGILRVRLLGIEPRLRWTISRGTVAAAFIAAYVVGSQAAALIIAPRYGPTAGVVAAGLLVLVLIPIQRGAERLAAVAIPAPDGTALDDHRLEAYRLALEDLSDSEDPRSLHVLASLRQRLGITERDHVIVTHFVRIDRQHGPAEPRPGELIMGRFRILHALGAGGHARAYLAEDEQLARKVVVKRFHAEREPDAVLREARAIGAIRHPNVVTVHDVALLGGHAVLVMEHMEGGSLKDLLQDGPLDRAAFSRLATDLVEALAAVHAAGLVHRDIKPSNVLLDAAGRAKLADFGVAALTGADPTWDENAPPEKAAGTLRYMSPEQAKGMRVGAASDQYALALTLYEAQTGTSRFEADPSEGASDARFLVAYPGPLPDDPRLDPPLRAWFRKALAPKPQDRFQDARAMGDALASALAGHVS